MINAIYYLSMLSFSLGYLFDKTHYPTPFHFLIKQRMRRLNEADYVPCPFPPLPPLPP